MKIYPSPAFKRQAVYMYWRGLGTSSWRLEEDAIESAMETLKKGEAAGGLGPNSNRFEIIPIPIPEVGHRAIAFALKDILEICIPRMREFAVDSVCQ